MEIKTNIELLNEISAKLGGKSDASVLVEGLNNIANALGDSDPDQMVTVSQALETVLEHMDGGGGGGSVENPSVTVKIVNDHISSDIFYAFYVFTDNRIELHFESVSADQDKTSTFMAMYDVEEETYIVNLGLLMPDNEYNERSATVTDLVNAEDWGDDIVAITDPTESASFTVIVSPEN